MEDVEADVMVRSSLLQALRAEPELAIRLITLLGARLRTAFDLVRILSIPSARVRVAHALLAMVSSEETADPSTIGLPVSNHEFARALGLAPETLSRVLTLLVDDGVLERAGSGRYRVLDPKKLSAAARPDPE
jgi:CRP-like cAMP-binding protein